MSDHQELDRQSAESRRDRARMLLDQAAEVDNNEELKRKLARQAFRLVQDLSRSRTMARLHLRDDPTAPAKSAMRRH